MKYIVLGIIGFIIFFIGLGINAIWFHSQGKSFTKMIKDHVNDYLCDICMDVLTVMFMLSLLCVPYFNIIFAVAVNFALFIRGFKD